MVRIEGKGEFLPTVALLDLVPRPAGAFALVVRNVDESDLRVVAQGVDCFFGTVLPRDAEVKGCGIGGLRQAVEHGRNELRITVGGDLDEDSGHEAIVVPTK